MDQSQKQQLQEKHLQLVIAENKTTNLTRIDSYESALLLHLEDSLAGLPEINDAPQGLAADLGIGAGFPGIPLTIETNRPFVLVESVGKKINALNRMIDELMLGDSVTTYYGRIEELALEKNQAFSLVTARALTALNSLIELASPLLMQGGRLIAYKSGDYRQELDEACAIQEKVGMKYLASRPLTLSDGMTKRSIVVFEKSGDPRVSLPRRPGMAQKRPYR